MLQTAYELAVSHLHMKLIAAHVRY